MDVVDHSENRRRFKNVAVVAAAALPETVVNLAIGFNIPQVLQEARSFLTKKLQSLSAYGHLQRGTNLGHFILRLARHKST